MTGFSFTSTTTTFIEQLTIVSLLSADKPICKEGKSMIYQRLINN
jgi:hypothetical protein